MKKAIESGDGAALEAFLKLNPDAARERVDGQRTPLHVATDWPGHFPNVRETIATLVRYGADLNAAFVGGPHTETPLHWAASSDDIAALDMLLDLGADIEVQGSVIGGGSALSDAVAFSCWAAARRLVERGAHVSVWQAAALGLTDRLEAYFEREVPPHEVTNAFWNACHGGQLEAARYLLAKGANVHWVGHDRLTPLEAAVRNGNDAVSGWLRSEEASRGSIR